MEEARIFEHIVTQLKEMLCIIDLDCVVRRINPAGLGMLDASPSDVQDKPWSEMFEQNSRPLAMEIINQTVDGGIWGGEILFQRGSGEIFPVYLTTSLIPDISGGANLVAAHATDITLKKKFEDTARKRSELMNKILTNAPVGIVAFDSDGRITIANNAFLQMIGKPSGVVAIGLTTAELDSNLNPQLTERIQRVLDGETISEIDFLLMADDSNRLNVSLHMIPLEGITGNVEGLLGLFEDRSDKIKMEEKLLQADKLSSMGYLAAGVAHEISNPLAGMYTIIESFRDQADRKGEPEEPYERILNDIDRIKGIIHKLLTFASPSAQAPQMTQLNDLIINTVEFFKHQPVYRRIRIKCDLADDLPETFMDRNQIVQVIHNLFINAAQAMPDGGELRAGTSTSGDLVIFTFEDTGIGISKENLGKIFDPFFTTKPAGTGTGLGLSVSYGIIQEHSGLLEVESEEGKGTKFTVTLPIKEVMQVFDEG